MLAGRIKAGLGFHVASLPSAKIATVVPSGTSSILPPADVSPGAMMLAPDRTKRIAPRSTWNLGRMSGYLLGGRAGVSTHLVGLRAAHSDYNPNQVHLRSSQG